MTAVPSEQLLRCVMPASTLLLETYQHEQKRWAQTQCPHRQHERRGLQHAATAPLRCPFLRCSADLGMASTMPHISQAVDDGTDHADGSSREMAVACLCWWPTCSTHHQRERCRQQHVFARFDIASANSRAICAAYHLGAPGWLRCHSSEQRPIHAAVVMLARAPFSTISNGACSF